MKEMERQWFTKDNLGKWFRRDNLIVLVLSGVLLFIIALPVKEKKAESAENSGSKDASGTQYTGQEHIGGKVLSYEADYAAYLENKLCDILQGVEGVGMVSVMVTLASSEELVVEKDEPLSRSDVRETDSAGGNRQTAQLETAESTVYQTDGSSSTPYVIKRLLPKVEGVLVVAQGADSGTVSRKLSETVQALFDVEAHKIKVMKMEETKRYISSGGDIQ